MKRGRTAGPLFRDRFHAGRLLAERLSAYEGRPDVVVLGLARGGMPVAYEVAGALAAPLDVFLVRKLGVPGHEELAMGAIASGGVRVLNPDVVRSLAIPGQVIEAVAGRETAELARREVLYRGDRGPVDLEGNVVVIVDDGLATGASMRAAVTGVRERRPRSIIVAVPTAAPEACAALGRLVDDIICLAQPDPFYGVGYWYEDFAQTGDEVVTSLLEQAALRGEG
jgi:predicted phosphoribosyltransferase